MEHGTILYDRYLNIYQVIGIPHPKDRIPVIPKYTPCSDGKWSLNGLRYCRVIKEYGPSGLKDALSKSKLSQEYDPLYGSLMPYLMLSEVLRAIRPRDALRNLVTGNYMKNESLLLDTINIINIIREETGIGLEDLGLTGSIAAGIAVSDFSDIDVVVYGANNSTLLYDFFKSNLALTMRFKATYGGVSVENAPRYSWRRGMVKGINRPVSWVGIPRNGEQCEVLKHYFSIDPPAMEWRGYIVVEGGQPTALIYPPCAATRDGTYIVSFEYNLASLLYEGGVFRINGVMGERGITIYLGLREYPGYIKVL
ncbi:MAG: hypothetical protein GSR85_09390 [Desulfurococcales archaeon]|nr:hypothetical protein [Desulfurococcales archaeon]